MKAIARFSESPSIADGLHAEVVCHHRSSTFKRPNLSILYIPNTCLGVRILLQKFHNPFFALRPHNDDAAVDIWLNALRGFTKSNLFSVCNTEIAQLSRVDEWHGSVDVCFFGRKALFQDICKVRTMDNELFSGDT